MMKYAWAAIPVVLMFAFVAGISWLDTHTYDQCIKTGRIQPGVYPETKGGLYHVMTDNGPGWTRNPEAGRVICLATERKFPWD